MPRGRPDRRIEVVDTLELEREIYSRSFREFIPPAFEVLEGGEAHAEAVAKGEIEPKFQANWHIDAMADHLQAVTDSHIRHLLMNVPPGTSKSSICCVLWLAWKWARRRAKADDEGGWEYPWLDHRFLTSSYSEEFSRRDVGKTERLITGGWYQRLFPHVQIKQTPNTMLEHHNTAEGFRQGASTNSGVTGKHVHGIVEDDPIKAQDAQSRMARDLAWFYHTQVLSSRLLPTAGWRVVVMQRLHEDDVSGRLISQAEGSQAEYTHLMLPMEFEGRRKCVTYLPTQKPHGKNSVPGEQVSTAPATQTSPPASSELRDNSEPTTRKSLFFEDPRMTEGELLWPGRMDRKFVDEKKSPVTGLGAIGYAGQYQERPAPAQGGMIQRDWLRYYKAVDLPKKFNSYEQSWDLIFDDDNPVGSFVCGQIWGRNGANHYLLFQYRKRVEFTVTIRAFVDITAAWPQATRKAVEKKANGAALISTLKTKIPGIVAISPKGKSKQARLEAVAPMFEAGNVWIPHPHEQPWIESWIEEVVGMTMLGPTTSNDDQVDAATQYLSDKVRARVPDMSGLDITVGVRESHWGQMGTVEGGMFPAGRIA